MKFVMDERFKHRLVGLAVLMSVAAIFLPAVLKKTNQPFDALSRVSVCLPAKPAMHEVKMVKESRLFKSVKMATVEVQQLPKAAPKVEMPKPVSLAPTPIHAPVHIEVARVSARQYHQHIPSAIAVSSLPAVPQNMKVRPVMSRVIHPALEPKVSLAVGQIRPSAQPKEKSVIAHAKPGYAIQVAYFSNINNAQTLISKLKAHGFSAHYKLVRHARGNVNYKVLVGQSTKREDISRIQHDLASQMKLNGFVVTEIG